MALSDITDRGAVLSAIAEFDRIGRDAFLAKYDFGESRSYWLVHEGKRYDSKAIIGAAHGYARPDLGALAATDFSGGEATVQRKLEELGFAVEVAGDARATRGQFTATASQPDAFLLTWKETGWPYENIERMLASFARDGFVEEEWRIQSHRRAKPGDRGWLLKQGPGPRGIFGVGTILERPHRKRTADGKERSVARVRFERLTDPRGQHLIDEADVRAVLPDTKINAQASGGSLTAEESDALEKLLEAADAPQVIDASAADPSTFDPATIQDAREKIARTIAQRRGQRAFRDALIEAYGGTCAISGCTVLDVLEAAHIHPYRGPETNHVQNGLLLRADLHTLFDCGLIGVDPSTLTVVIDAKLTRSEYQAWHGRPLRRPRNPTHAPSKEALQMQKEGRS
jgi:putative restriction endonuclease